MLPILPLILILLLQGPANVERLAREGRLPAALEQIHREIARPSLPVSAREEALYASLRAAGGDPELSSVLFALLRKPEPASPEPTEIPSREPRVALHPAPPLREGHEECRRSRDGPSWNA